MRWDHVRVPRAREALLHPILVILALSSAASAQDDLSGSLDAASVTFAPGQGQEDDPLLGWQPASRAARDWSASATFGFAARALNLQEFDEDGQPDGDPISLAGDLTRLDLGASVALTERFGLALSLPAYLYAAQDDAGGGARGPALGELRLAAPLRLSSAGPVGVSVLPWLDLPALDGPSDAPRFLGSDLPGVGALAVLGWRQGPWSLHANLGAELSPGEVVGYGLDGDDPDVLLDHSFQALAVVGGSRALGPLRLFVEGYAAPALQGEDGAIKIVAGGEADTLAVTTPAELLTYARWTLPSGLGVTGGGGVALSGAPGTPLWRAFVGLRFAPPRERPEAPLTNPGLDVAGPADLLLDVDSAEGRRIEGFVRVSGQDQPYALDADGKVILPLGEGQHELSVEVEGHGRQVREVLIEPGRLTPASLNLIVHRSEGQGVVDLTLIDPEERRVEGAEVFVDGASYGDAGNAGRVRVEGLGRGEHLVDVVAEDFVDFTGRWVGDAPEQILLERLPGSVRVVVHGPEGPLPQARVRVLGPEPVDDVPLDAEGQQTFQLRPGAWALLVSTEAYGLQQRDVLISDDFTGLVEVRFDLQPAEGGEASLALRVVDPDGRPVEGARVSLGGLGLGTTASGGALRVDGLAPGPRTLDVQADRFRPREAVEVELVEGLRELLVTLDWLPGSVRVIATTQDGPVRDAEVRLMGPAQSRTTPLGPDGVGFFSLAPGKWTLLLSAPSLGLQSRDVQIEPDETSLIEIKAVLLDDEGGDASLTLRVTDPDGRPVTGAEVLLDGQPVGTTASGSLTLAGLKAGPRQVTVQGATLREKVLGEVQVQAGDNQLDVPMLWRPGSVRVRTVSAAGGALLDAMVRLIGPDVLPAVRLGADGERTFTLAPGDWLVVVSSESHGLGQREVVVSPDQQSLVELEFALDADPSRPVLDELPRRDVDVVVRTAEGRPVDAEVRFLGAERVDIGRTGASGRKQVSLRPGAWEVIASAAEYGARREEFVLEPGAAPAEVLVEVDRTQVEVTERQVRIKQQVFFEVDRAVIRPESYALLDELANTLLVNPQIRLVEVQGHTDDQGGADYNQALSEARAAAVRDHLVSRGVSARRLVARGYGDTQPVADNATAEGRAENRRVQFEILEQD